MKSKASREIDRRLNRRDWYGFNKRIPEVSFHARNTAFKGENWHCDWEVKGEAHAEKLAKERQDRKQGLIDTEEQRKRAIQEYEDRKKGILPPLPRRNTLRKLSDSEVIFMRRTYPEHDIRQFARSFGVSESTIRFALCGETYKHVNSIAKPVVFKKYAGARFNK